MDIIAKGGNPQTDTFVRYAQPVGRVAVNENRTLAFAGTYRGASGAEFHSGFFLVNPAGAVTQLVEMPVSGILQDEGLISFRGNKIVFKECDGQNCRIATLDTTTGVKRAIISHGDCLLGEPVTSLGMAPNALDHDGMPVFKAVNAKGVVGIFRARDIVPSYGGASAKIVGPNSGTVGVQVNLDASQSSSANNNDMGYEWELLDKPSQSSVAFTTSSRAWIHTGFVPDVPGQYTVRLTVKTCDSAGPFISTKDLTILVAGASGGNNPPAPSSYPIWVAPGATGTTQISPNDPDSGQSHTFEIEPAVPWTAPQKLESFST